MSEQKIILRTEFDKSKLVEFIQNLNIEKPWKFEWKRYNPNRSLSQNALYWSWMQEIAIATDNDKDLCHEAFKDMFCPVLEIKLSGKIVQTRSTSKLDKKEMGEYMTRVSAYAATDLGVFLTHPEDQHIRE